ncbi:MAG: hypothetical protein IT462_13200 [Planctomycetes bacterium]|nr:hypothetical protein [Planctomycetota bacterium]
MRAPLIRSFLPFTSTLLIAVLAVVALSRPGDAPVRGDDTAPRPAGRSALDLAYDALEQARQRLANAKTALEGAQRELERAGNALVEAVNRADREVFSLLSGDEGLDVLRSRVEGLYVEKFRISTQCGLLTMDGQSLEQTRAQWEALARYREHFADGTFTRIDRRLREMNAEIAAMRERERAVEAEITREMGTYRERQGRFETALRRGIRAEDLEAAYMAAEVSRANAETEFLAATQALIAAQNEYVAHVRDGMPPYLQRLRIKSGDRVVYEAQWVRKVGDAALENLGLSDERMADQVDAKIVEELVAFQSEYNACVAEFDADRVWYRDYEPRMVERTRRIVELADSIGSWAMAKVAAPLAIEILAVVVEVFSSGGAATAARHAAEAAAAAGVAALERAAARRAAGEAAGDAMAEVGENLVERAAREMLEQYARSAGEARRRFVNRAMTEAWSELGEVVQRSHRLSPEMHQRWLRGVAETAGRQFDADVKLMQGVVTEAARREFIDNARTQALETMKAQWKREVAGFTDDADKLVAAGIGKPSGWALAKLFERTVITGSASAGQEGAMSLISDGVELGTGALITLARRRASEAVARVATGAATTSVRSWLASKIAYPAGTNLSDKKLFEAKGISIAVAKAAIAAFCAHKQQEAEREMGELMGEAQVEHEIYYKKSLRRLQLGLEMAELGRHIAELNAARQVIRAPNHLRVVTDNLLDIYPANLVFEMTFSSYVKSAILRVGGIQTDTISAPTPSGTLELSTAVSLTQRPSGSRLPIQVSALDMNNHLFDGDPTTTCMFNMRKQIEGHEDRPDVHHSIKLGGSQQTRMTGKWQGKVYKFDNALTSMPDLANKQPIYTYETEALNWPLREATAGFPCIPGNLNLVENYAIEFEGGIEAPRDLRYRFHLVSDDGSKLWVDDALVVDHDHTGHSPRYGDSTLTAGTHKLKVHYFQGGRPSIALQFFVQENGAPIPPAVLSATAYAAQEPEAFEADSRDIGEGKGRLFTRCFAVDGTTPRACSATIYRQGAAKHITWDDDATSRFDLDPGQYTVKFKIDDIEVERTATVTEGAVTTCSADFASAAAVFDFNLRTQAGELPGRNTNFYRAGTTERVRYLLYDSGRAHMLPGTYDISVSLQDGGGPAGEAWLRNVTVAAGQCLRVEYGPIGRVQWTVTGAQTDSGCWLYFYPSGANTHLWGHWSGERGWRDLPPGSYDVKVQYLDPTEFWIRDFEIRAGDAVPLNLSRRR